METEKEKTCRNCAYYLVGGWCINYIPEITPYLIPWKRRDKPCRDWEDKENPELSLADI